MAVCSSQFFCASVQLQDMALVTRSLQSSPAGRKHSAHHFAIVQRQGVGPDLLSDDVRDLIRVELLVSALPRLLEPLKEGLLGLQRLIALLAGFKALLVYCQILRSKKPCNWTDCMHAMLSTDVRRVTCTVHYLKHSVHPNMWSVLLVRRCILRTRLATILPQQHYSEL